jgi:hypothetical protein
MRIRVQVVGLRTSAWKIPWSAEQQINMVLAPHLFSQGQGHTHAHAPTHTKAFETMRHTRTLAIEADETTLAHLAHVCCHRIEFRHH